MEKTTVSEEKSSNEVKNSEIENDIKNLQKQNSEKIAENANKNQNQTKNIQQEKNIFLISNQNQIQNSILNQNFSSNQSSQNDANVNIYNNNNNFSINSQGLNKNPLNSPIQNNIPQITVPPILTYSDDSSFDEEEENAYLKMIEARNEQQKTIQVPLNDPSQFHISDLEAAKENENMQEIQHISIISNKSIDNSFESQSDTEIDIKRKEEKIHEMNEKDNDIINSIVDGSDAASYSSYSSIISGNKETNSITNENIHKRKHKKKQSSTKRNRNSSKGNPKVNALPLVYAEQLIQDMDSSSTQSSSMTSSDDYISPYGQNTTEYVDTKKFFMFRIPEIPHITNEAYDNYINTNFDLNELITAMKKQ